MVETFILRGLAFTTMVLMKVGLYKRISLSHKSKPRIS